jgi:hypothetical protein
MKHVRTLASLSLALAGAVVLSPIAGAAVHAQAAALPAAKTITDRYVAAVGGRDALAKVSSIEMRGTLELPAAGLKADLSSMSARPNRRALKKNLPGLGEVQTGFDGETAWEVNPMQGPRLLTGKELDAARDDADFEATYYDPKSYKSLETLEVTDFAGEKAYKVRAVRTSGLESTDYFSVASGLLLGRTESRETAMGTMALTITWSDYKDFGGIKFPTRLEQKVDEQSMLSSISSITLNTVSDSVFALPPAVKALKK